MSSTKRARGRPKKNSSISKEDTQRDNNPYDDDAFYGYKSEQKQTYSGEILHSCPSIIKVQEPNQTQWLSAIGPVQRCFDHNCETKHFHCPLCPVALTQYEHQVDLQEHFMKIHTHQHFCYSDHVIVLCNLGCFNSFASHYHCPKCGHTTGRSLHMRNHLSRCTTTTSQQECGYDSESPSPKRQRRARNKLFSDDNEVHDIWEGVQVKKEPANGNKDATVLSVNEANSVGMNDEQNIFTFSEINVPAGPITTNYETGIKSLQQPTDTLTTILSMPKVDQIKSILAPEADREQFPQDLEVIQVQIDGQETQYMVVEKSGDSLLNLQQQETLLKTKDPKHSHISIVRHVEDLECCRCQTCCKLFHCPLCPKELYEPKAPSALRIHLKQHFTCGVLYKGWTSMKCNLACDADTELVKAHWHCPLCPQKKLHRSRLREHLSNHKRGRTRVRRVNMKNDETSTDDLKSAIYIDEDVKKIPTIEDDQSIDKQCNGNNVENEAQDDMSNSNMNGELDIKSDSRDCNDVSNVNEEHLDSRAGHSEEAFLHKKSINSNVTTEEIVCPDNLTDAINEDGAVHVIYLEDIFSQAEDIANINGELKVGESILVDNAELSSKIHSKGETVAMLDHKYLQADDGLQDRNVTELNIQVDNSSIVGTVDDVVTHPNQVEEKDDVTKCSQVFQIVAGLLTSNLVQKLHLVLDEFLVLLHDSTGINAKPQDPEGSGYLLEGSWSQLDKSRIILEMVAQAGDSGVLNLNAIFQRAQKENPDMFQMSMPFNEESAVDSNEEKSEDYGEPDQNLDITTNIDQQTKNPSIEANEEPIKLSENEPCPYCLKKFRYKTSLFSHIINVHNLNKKPRINLEKWGTTLIRMTEVKKPECPTCGKTFTKLLHAQTHYSSNVCSTTRSNAYDILLNPETGKYQCEHCNYSCSAPSTLLQHNKCKHFAKTIPCPSCDKMFATDDVLQNHIKNVHIKTTICTVCGINVKMTSLDKHMKSHESGDKGSIPQRKCIHCDYCTSVPQFMERHIQREHESQSNKCKECGMQFTVRATLYNHMVSAHSIVPGNLALLYGNCPVCHKNMLKRNIAAHVRLKHRGDRRYKCSTCNKAFQTKYVLDIHRQTHLAPGERRYRYICSLCAMGFQSKSMYTDHVRTHTNHRPYRCSTCANTFRQKNVYQRHLEIHKPNRFSCKVCQQVYTTKYSLQQHMKQHQNPDPALANTKSDFKFICLCGESFPETSALQTHTKSCSTIEQSCHRQSDDVDAQISLLTQGGDSSTVLLLQPENSSSSHGLLPNSQAEVLMIKLDGNTHSIPEISADDMQTIDTINQLGIVEADDINLADSNSINMSLIDTEDANIPEKDGYLCGYCNTLFGNLEDVQTHIVLEHGDQLPRENDVHVEER